jgi:hypothetical protein
LLEYFSKYSNRVFFFLFCASAATSRHFNNIGSFVSLLYFSYLGSRIIYRRIESSPPKRELLVPLDSAARATISPCFAQAAESRSIRWSVRAAAIRSIGRLPGLPWIEAIFRITWRKNKFKNIIFRLRDLVGPSNFTHRTIFYVLSNGVDPGLIVRNLLV